MANIFLSENEPIHRWNGNILNIAKIMKYVPSLASEAEMGALLLTAKRDVIIETHIDQNGMASASLTNSM